MSWEAVRAIASIASALIVLIAAIAAVRQLRHMHVAAVLLGFIDAYRSNVSWKLPASDQRGYDLLVRSVGDQLSASDIILQRARGAQLDYDAAVELL
jgi:hypothetical protein